MVDIIVDKDLLDLNKKFLTFEVGAQMFAFPINSIKEIIKVEKPVPIPNMPSYIKGVINLRGKIITLVDVNLRLGWPEKEYTDRTCIVNVEVEDRLVGFIVDVVNEVIDINDEDISSDISVSKEAQPYLKGVGKTEKGIVLLLNSQLIIDKDIVEEFNC